MPDGLDLLPPHGLFRFRNVLNDNNPGYQRRYGLIFRLNNVAHVRGNCQTTTAEHPLGIGGLYKTKPADRGMGHSRGVTEFHQPGDGRHKRFRRPQRVNLAIFWQLTRGLQFVQIIYFLSADSNRAHSCWHLYFKKVHSTFSRGVYEDSPSQIRININVVPRFWDPRLGVRALIQSDACLRNQMMSLWWHVANGVPNVDSKFNFPLLWDHISLQEVGTVEILSQRDCAM